MMRSFHAKTDRKYNINSPELSVRGLLTNLILKEQDKSLDNFARLCADYFTNNPQLVAQADRAATEELTRAHTMLLMDYLKQVLRPVEYRTFLSQIYYNVAEEQAIVNDKTPEVSNEQQHTSDDTKTDTGAHEPRSEDTDNQTNNSCYESQIIDMIQNSLVPEVYDLENKNHNLHVLSSPGHLNRELDRKRYKREMVLLQRIKLAAARLDGMRAAVMLVGSQELAQFEGQDDGEQ